MSLKSKLGSLVVLYCASTLALAAEQPLHSSAPELIESLINHSGLTGLSYQARHLAQQAMNDSAAPLGTQYEVVEAIAPVWGMPSLTNLLTDVSQKLTAQQQQTLLQLFQSPLMLQARERELQALAEQNSAAYLSYVQQLRTQPPAPARLEQIEALDQAMRFSALLIRTRASVYQQLEGSLSQWRAPENWQQDLQQHTLEFLFYVHRSTPSSSLQRLIQNYQVPQMQHWLQQVEGRLPNFTGSVAAAE